MRSWPSPIGSRCIYEGRIMDILPREDATPRKLGLLMAGVKADEGNRQNSNRPRIREIVAVSRAGKTLQLKVVQSKFHWFGGRWCVKAATAWGQVPRKVPPSLKRGRPT